LTEQQAFLANIEENRVRNATTPMDDAYNIQRLVNVYQMTQDAVADAYRASISWVKGRLQLIEATPEVEKAVRAGKITGSAAKAIAKLSKEHQKNLATVAEAKGKVTAADIKKEVGEPPETTAKADKPDTAQESALLRNFRLCNYNQRERVLQLAHDLAEKRTEVVTK
jgi:ParB-like chromosome segregation protein Spo0J